MQIRFSTKRFAKILFAVWFLLVIGGFCAEAWKYILYNEKNELTDLFGLSYEQNLPTWYSSSLLLVCAVLLGLISTAKFQGGQPYRWHWLLLSLMFGYISIDETVTLHEELSNFFDLQGVLFYGWIIPAGIAVGAIGLSYLPFLIHLPGVTRGKFMISGAIYVGGALLMELPLGWWTDQYGGKNLGYGLIDLVEESMEILGVTIFLLALVQYVRLPTGRVEVVFEEQGI